MNPTGSEKEQVVATIELTDEELQGIYGGHYHDDGNRFEFRHEYFRFRDDDRFSFHNYERFRFRDGNSY
jgi:bacteriocin-like protein